MLDAIFVGAFPGYERYNSSESSLKNETPDYDCKVLQILSYRSPAIWTTFFITDPNSGAFEATNPDQMKLSNNSGQCIDTFHRP
jgi:hypothetical protein